MTQNFKCEKEKLPTFQARVRVEKREKLPTFHLFNFLSPCAGACDRVRHSDKCTYIKKKKKKGRFMCEKKNYKMINKNKQKII